MRGGATAGKLVKGRSKDKTGSESAAELAEKMRWLQEQAAKRAQAWDALQSLKDKAAGEADLSRTSNLTVMAEMRKLMRDEKLAALQSELGVIAALHEVWGVCDDVLKECVKCEL